jgi:CubicO group peptidase (beta-lactamase class C family)
MVRLQSSPQSHLLTSTGKFRYEKAFGTRSLKDPSPLKIDATMWLASCTKFMTTIAAMQCVEKGLLSLDGDVTDVLPELKGREILMGFEEGSQKPILVENTKKITLRYGFEVWLVKKRI